MQTKDNHQERVEENSNLKAEKPLSQPYCWKFPLDNIVAVHRRNHKINWILNVVKLWGCCLETFAPLLVYKFVPNGTMFEYIHNESKLFSISWETCLRIVIETMEALSYLHSTFSTPSNS